MLHRLIMLCPPCLWPDVCSSASVRPRQQLRRTAPLRRTLLLMQGLVRWRVQREEGHRLAQPAARRA